MDGIERIKVLASEIKDEQVLQIINYLITREDMNEKYLNEEKSLKQMLEFIGNEVKKNFNPISIGVGVKMACTTNEQVYGIAIHYWDESNEILKLKNNNEKNNAENSSKNIDDVIEKTKNTERNKPSKKDWVPEGQLKLF